MKTTFYISLIIALMSSSLYTKQGLFAQNVGINSTGATAHPSALLDLDASASPSVGLLVPRISLSLTTLPAPVTGPANSLMVYNLATTTGTAGVSPGYYYWDATALKWIRIQTSATTANDWNLLGNAGTTPGINFLGTTDAKDLVFKTNGVEAIRTTTAGNVGVGTTTPAERFTLENGSMQLGETMPAVGVGRELTFSDRFNNTDVIWFRRENISFDESYLNLIIGDNYGGGASNDKFNVGANGGGTYHPVFTVDVSANRVGIGTTTPGFNLDVAGTTACAGNVWTSDKRKKQNIKSLTLSGLDIVTKLNPVTYEWKTVLDDGMKGTQMGFIAQELEQILPGIVVTANNEDKSKGVKYNELLPVIVKAIQEQQAQIEDLKKINETQQQQIDALKKLLQK